MGSARHLHSAARLAALLSLMGSAFGASSGEISSGESDSWMDDDTCGIDTFCWKAAVAGGVSALLLLCVLAISFATRRKGFAVAPEPGGVSSKQLHEMSPRAYAEAMARKKKETEVDQVESIAPGAAGMEVLDVEEGAPASAPEAAEEAKADA